MFLVLSLQISLGQSATLGPRQLPAQIQRLVLAALVELTQVLLLCLMDDCQNSSNTFPNHSAAVRRKSSAIT